MGILIGMIFLGLLVMPVAELARRLTQRRSYRITACVVTYFVIWSVIGWADEGMPNYDIQAYCNNRHEFGVSEEDCVKGQYIARGNVVHLWKTAAPNARVECVAAANRFGNYDVLFACLYSHQGDQ